jgi:hypothetical protein
MLRDGMRPESSNDTLTAWSGSYFELRGSHDRTLSIAVIVESILILCPVTRQRQSIEWLGNTCREQPSVPAANVTAVKINLILIRLLMHIAEVRGQMESVCEHTANE